MKKESHKKANTVLYVQTGLRELTDIFKRDTKVSRRLIIRLWNQMQRSLPHLKKEIVYLKNWL